MNNNEFVHKLTNMICRDCNMLDLVFEEYRFSRESHKSLEETEPIIWTRAKDNKVALIKVTRAWSQESH